MMICVAGVDDLSGRGYGVRSALSLSLVRYSVMISGRRQWCLRRAAMR